MCVTESPSPSAWRCVLPVTRVPRQASLGSCGDRKRSLIPFLLEKKKKKKKIPAGNVRARGNREVAGATIALKGRASDFMELTWGWPWGVEGWTACCRLEGSPQSALPRFSLAALPVGAACSPLSPHPPEPPALSPHPGGWGAQPWLPAASPSSHRLSAGSYLSEASVVPLPFMRCSGTQAGTRGLLTSPASCASRGPDS